MSKKVITLKSRISRASRNEIHNGWVRISKDLRVGIDNGEYVQIIIGKKKVYCQIRGTFEKPNRVIINEWYRHGLCLTDLSKQYELTIKKVGLIGRFRAWSSHPDDVVRVGTSLGMTSVGLGLLSVILATLPPSIRLMASNCKSDHKWGIVSIVFELLLIPLVVFLLSWGLWIFVRKPTQPIGKQDC